MPDNKSKVEGDEVETERLRLRMFRLEDLDELAPIFGDPEVVTHLGSGKPASREETEVALHSIIRHWEQHGFGRWAAVCKTTRKLIGYCGLRNFHGAPELVYLLAKESWGKGFATEMALASLEYGFVAKKFGRIIAMTKTANLASQRVLKKVGMVFDGSATICEMEVFCYSQLRQNYLARLRESETSQGGPLIISDPGQEHDSLIMQPAA